MLPIVILAVLVGTGMLLYFLLSGNAARTKAERRRRYALHETEERVPFAPPPMPAPPPVIRDDLASPQPAPGTTEGTRIFEDSLATVRVEGFMLADEPSLDVPPPVEGRMVLTPDGEMIITTPPFRLRESILSPREAAYAAAISRRLPRGLALCPKVRLETLLTPTPPDGRDPEDWRTWRRRVRMRAVDFVICDTRGGAWRPLIAVEVDRSPMAIHKIGGGVDRMIDEVLTAVGLPFVRCTGEPEADWPMIEPYLRDPAVA
jgi:hypothetical protein